MYNGFKKAIGDGTIDWEGDTIKVALVTSTYTPDIDADVYFGDITNEVSGTGYTAGGATLVNTAVTVDTVNNWAEYNADDTTWSTASVTARGAVVYMSTGTASTSPLINYVDFTVDKTSSAGDFKITWDASGVVKLA